MKCISEGQVDSCYLLILIPWPLMSLLCFIRNNRSLISLCQYIMDFCAKWIWSSAQYRSTQLLSSHFIRELSFWRDWQTVTTPGGTSPTLLHFIYHNWREGDEDKTSLMINHSSQEKRLKWKLSYAAHVNSKHVVNESMNEWRTLVNLWTDLF